jgi:hypothetical protein
MPLRRTPKPPKSVSAAQPTQPAVQEHFLRFDHASHRRFFVWFFLPLAYYTSMTSGWQSCHRHATLFAA